MIKRTRLLVLAMLVWLRWLLAIFPGYIHPDEFFQNPEITASYLFPIETMTPWEYQPQHAARSIVMPYLTTGIPFYILRLFTDQLPTSYQLFLTERTSTFVYSLILDVCVYRICRRLHRDWFIPLILVATSQVTLTFCTRPFSNAFESILLCLCLTTYMNRKPNDSSAFMLGALFSLGTFTRITFPVYGIPIGIALLIDSYRNRSIRSILQLISGLLLVSGLCILIDSLYYQTLEIHNLSSLSQIRIKGVFTITPLNNLIYNTNVSNLESHGLHPWYTHLLVNMPLLYGPLFIYLLVQSPHLLNTESHSVRVCLGILFTSLLGLSLIPHQEARFLCPLLIPLVLIYTSTKIPASFYLLWILFNIITSYVFGIAHQGGLVLAMGFLQRQTTGIHDCSLLKNGNVACSIGKSGTQELNGFQLKTDLVFYKTYMPPQHLLVYPKDHHGNHVKVFDYASDLNATVHHLSQSAPVILTQPKYRNPRIHFAHTSEPDVFERTLLITPSFIPLPVVPHRQYLLLASYSPHISFDDMDFMLQQVVENTPDNPLSLNVFLILSST